MGVFPHLRPPQLFFKNQALLLLYPYGALTSRKKLEKPNEQSLRYCKIPNISLGLTEVRKHLLGGLYSGGLIFGGHFVLVSEYQDLKSHCFI